MSTFKECEVTQASKPAGLHETEYNENFRGKKVPLDLLQTMYEINILIFTLKHTNKTVLSCLKMQPYFKG